MMSNLLNEQKLGHSPYINYVSKKLKLHGWTQRDRPIEKEQSPRRFAARETGLKEAKKKLPGVCVCRDRGADGITPEEFSRGLAAWLLCLP